MHKRLCLLLFGLCSLGARGASAQDSAAGRPLFTFGVVTDVQYADRATSGTRHYRSSPAKLAHAVEVFNAQGVDFVLSLGDFINDGLGSFDTLRAITRRLRMPLYHVLGNHDFGVRPEEKKLVLGKMGLKKPYRSFVRGPWRFILLNGDDISLFAPPKGSRRYRQAERWLEKLRRERAPNAKDWNAAIGQAQQRWLRRQLRQAQRRGQKVVLACHFPLYPDGRSELLWNAADIRRLIASSPAARVYLYGHTHTSGRAREDGIWQVGFRGMVEGEENAFAVVSVYADHMQIQGYGLEPSGTLEGL